jgi:N-acetylmuramoyl-L-alanine amidase
MYADTGGKMIIKEDKLSSELTDSFTVKEDPSPNSYSTLVPKRIVIHYSESDNIESIISTFKINDGSAAHLIVSRDGKQVVQMVPFNKKAAHTIFFNDDTIGIELDYVGYLHTNTHSTHFKHLNNFPPEKRLWGYYIRGDRYQFWPLYPTEQLTTLLALCKELVKIYPTITSIVGHGDIEPKPDPGPAFPMEFFREEVFGNTNAGTILKNVNQPVELRTGPGDQYPLIADSKIFADKGVAVFDDQNKSWAMVEVMEPENGNQWKVGWLPKDHLTNRDYQIVVKDHTLFGQDVDNSLKKFRQIKIPESNFGKENAIENIRYIIIHYTGATTMSSTINHFLNENSVVSSHLLVGRDGSIVQFVPFNLAAYHCGYSYWEGLEGINQYSIGIEIVNAGPLKISEDGHLKSGKETIREDDSELGIHWKSLSDQMKRWQKYPPIQQEAVKKIILALKDIYPIEDILGHDMINLREKNDPGPLFPMEAFREEIFGRLQPKVQKWKIINDNTTIYYNQDYKPPHPKQLNNSKALEFNAKFTLIDKVGYWMLIRAKGRRGWIRNRSYTYVITNPAKGKGKIKKDGVVLYNTWFGQIKIVPPLIHPASSLPTGSEIRVQLIKEPWALIASIPGDSYFEGWIKLEDIEMVN